MNISANYSTKRYDVYKGFWSHSGRYRTSTIQLLKYEWFLTSVGTAETA